MSELTHRLAGDGKPSMGTFLRVIDILIEESRKPQMHARDDRAQDGTSSGSVPDSG